MLYAALPSNQEHPIDVLNAAMRYADNCEPFALAVITNTFGGAVRAPGAMMAISAGGETTGYLSGGCIDSDVQIRAQKAIEYNMAERLKYGEGSPFIDIKLPCGGTIELAILPNPDQTVLRSTLQRLEAGQRTSLKVLSDNIALYENDTCGSEVFYYRPKLHMRIAGRGAEPIALAKIAHAGGIRCDIWSPEDECIELTRSLSGIAATKLTSPNSLPNLSDGKETAFVLMFHDVVWETALLKQAVQGGAFYIGAVGSKSTHAARCKRLQLDGFSDADISKIRGPIGLVPSMRDATMLSYSIIAEIVEAFHAEANIRS